jgi:predicted transcriptional regulator
MIRVLSDFAWRGGSPSAQEKGVGGAAPQGGTSGWRTEGEPRIFQLDRKYACTYNSRHSVQVYAIQTERLAGKYMDERPALSKGEWEIARPIWELGEATVGEVYEAIPEDRRPDYSTVQTYIRRLEAKGYLKSRRKGRTKIYAPKVRAADVLRETVDDFVGRLFDGETIPLMRHLIHDRGITSAEISELRKLLSELEDNQDE